MTEKNCFLFVGLIFMYATLSLSAWNIAPNCIYWKQCDLIRAEKESSQQFSLTFSLMHPHIFSGLA